MVVTRLTRKKEIERVLRRSPEINLMALGDLDDFFWPYTSWYGLEENARIHCIALLYSKGRPTLIAIEDGRMYGFETLLGAMADSLPPRFNAHLSHGLADALSQRYICTPIGECTGMILRSPELIQGVEASSSVRQLTMADVEEVSALYAEGFPENWFEAFMLQTGRYFGVRVNGKLVSAAGVHVYSPAYKVAVLGNIATHPEFRRNGFASAACAHLCRSLWEEVEIIGLNVYSQNAAAIACYQKLGFLPTTKFFIYDFLLKTDFS